MKPHRFDGLIKLPTMIVLFVSTSVLSGWVKKAMITSLSAVSMDLMSSLFQKSDVSPALVQMSPSSWSPVMDDSFRCRTSASRVRSR